MAVPTYTEALAFAIERELAKSEDKFIRVEDIFGIDVDVLLEILDPAKQKRFGFISPYLRHPCRRKTFISRDPRLITRWRNQPIRERRANPTIVFGAATGREEAGLKKVPSIVRPQDTLNAYREMILGYLKENIRSTSPKTLCVALIGMAGEHLIDIGELDAFFARVLRDDRSAVTDTQRDLWKLRLVPDARAIDDDSPGGRITRNYQIVELLRTQADTTLQERQLERLEVAADRGNATAAAALKFRANGKKAELKDIELDALLAIMNASGAGPGPGPTPRPIEFFDALDEGLLDGDDLKKITSGWKPEQEALNKDIQASGKLVRVSWKADTKVFKLVVDGRQVIATTQDVEADLESATPIYGDDLLRAARNVDVVKGGNAYETLATKVLATREKAACLLRWHGDLLSLLIVSDEIRTIAEEYFTAWDRLTDQVNNEEERAAASALQKYLSLLDGHWVSIPGGGEPARFQSVDLMCVHPYVIRPLLELAQYARIHVGEKMLGTRVQWAYDRVLPAYPAIWRDGDVFIHTEGEECPKYAQRAPRSLPSLSTARGLTEIIQSFVGLHPYAKKHLSILIIDPPSGGGIGKALDSCMGGSGHVESMTVYVAHTDRRDTEFPSVRAKVVYLGNIKSAEVWATETGVAVHVAVAFRRARDAGAGSHTGVAAPSRGLHNSLTASLEPPENADGDDGNSWVPKVFLQPRDSNDVVQRVMLLSRQSYSADRLYRISPMLPESDASELERIAGVCEWFVIATPSPIGLVPPRNFPGNTLTYLGREDCGPYGMFVYARDLFTVRKQFEHLLDQAPMAVSSAQVEAEVRALALKVPNGILRIGRAEGQVITQIGLMASSSFAQES